MPSPKELFFAQKDIPALIADRDKFIKKIANVMAKVKRKPFKPWMCYDEDGDYVVLVSAKLFNILTDAYEAIYKQEGTDKQKASNLETYNWKTVKQGDTIQETVSGNTTKSFLGNTTRNPLWDV